MISNEKLKLQNRFQKTALLSLFFVVIIGLNSTKLNAQTVSIDSIQYYIGKTVTVCDKVYGAHVSKSAKSATYINLGDNFPNNKLTVVIFESELSKFGYVPSVFLKDKEICVTGKVLLYKDKPEIIVNDSNNITYK